MPDPTAIAPRQPRPPRRPRPIPPPLDLVAVAALDLDPESPVAGYLRSTPSVGDRMRRIEAVRYVERHAPELGFTRAEQLASVRYGTSTRTLRRHRLGR